jgi:hypothetical protein
MLSMTQHDEKSPVDLVEHHRRRLAEIYSSDMIHVRRAFQILRSTERRLSLRELDTLISLQTKHKTKEAVKLDSQFPTWQIVQSRTKGLLRIRSDRVAFVHPLSKDALIQDPRVKPSTPISFFQIAPLEDHKFLAEQCMRYLLLGMFEVDESDVRNRQ